MNGLQNTSTDSMFAPLTSKTPVDGVAEVANAHSNPEPQTANAFADILVRLNTGDPDFHTTLPHVTFHGESVLDLLPAIGTWALDQGTLNAKQGPPEPTLTFPQTNANAATPSPIAVAPLYAALPPQTQTLTGFAGETIETALPSPHQPSNIFADAKFTPEVPVSEVLTDTAKAPMSPVSEVLADTTKVPTIPVSEVLADTTKAPATPVSEVLADTTKTSALPVSEVLTDTTKTPASPVSEVLANTTKVPSIPVSEILADTTKVPATPVSEVLADTTKAPATPVSEVLADTTKAPATPVSEVLTDTTKAPVLPVSEVLADTTKVPVTPVSEVLADATKVPTIPVSEVLADTTKAPALPVSEVRADTIKTPAIPVSKVLGDTTKTPDAPVSEVLEDTTKTPAIPVAEVLAKTPKPSTQASVGKASVAEPATSSNAQFSKVVEKIQANANTPAESSRIQLAHSATPLTAEPLPVMATSIIENTVSPIELRALDLAQATPAKPSIAPLAPMSHMAIQQVSDAIVKRADKGGEIVLRLDPAELGKVSITFTFDKNNGVTANVVAETSSTAAILRERADVLATQLKQSGFDDINLSFDNQEDAGSSSGFSSQFSGQHANQNHPSPKVFDIVGRDDMNALDQHIPNASVARRYAATDTIDIKL